MIRTTKFRHIPRLVQTRLYSTEISPAQLSALDKWIGSPNKLILSDRLSYERVSDLYITLPTRDGMQRPYEEPQESQPLPYGHHFGFFHARTPEALLKADGTDPELCPPDPFIRRMWTGGRIEWNNANPLLIGAKAASTATVGSVAKKGFEKGKPMVFVNMKIDITMEGKSEPSVTETRAHVYLPPSQVKDVPTTSHFSFSFLPGLTTLFRFSALMFNAHHIHLDKDITQIHEGYPERLVHGPLTAMMLLEAAVFHNPGLKLKTFEYRATNPLIVNRKITIHGLWNDRKSAKLWCVDENGVVGMVGSIEKDV
ncbi:hypothetical protein AMATHDRAFT_135843 [Amanita thiersii Skay4041]|uniref:MaoC-like domain-containing protein n=1 Tax=Amanita thiersii Skay4041 TaxID=703135 RepID=A0A2A9NTK5_9AGAR|nr:hypothetical protein AMATHDRAFT_135843 [Amanita thiersii Skay4041]